MPFGLSVVACTGAACGVALGFSVDATDTLDWSGIELMVGALFNWVAVSAAAAAGELCPFVRGTNLSTAVASEGASWRDAGAVSEKAID